jgi:hypothetical protein
VRRDFPPVQTGPGAHPASRTLGAGSFPGVKYDRCVLLTHHPLLVPWSWKSRAIPLPTLWVTTGPVTGTHTVKRPLQNRHTRVLKSGVKRHHQHHPYHYIRIYVILCSVLTASNVKISGPLLLRRNARKFHKFTNSKL